MSALRYMPGLDGLRFLSFAFVFFFHALEHGKTTQVSASMLGSLKIFEVGWIGVDIFFVLSGFLITAGLLRSRSEPRYFVNFYIKRAYRIFPLYYAVCLGAFVLLPVVAVETMIDSAELQRHGWLFFLHLQNWWMSFPGTDGTFLTHFWSLAVEEQFYLLWPLCIAWMPSGKRGIAICASLVAAVLTLRCVLWYTFGHPIHQLLHFSTLTRIDTLVIGSILAMLVANDRRFSDFNYVRVRACLLIATSVAFIALVWPNHPNWPTQTVGFTLIGLGAAGLVMLLRLPQGDNSILAFGPLPYLGKISYGLYVYHWPCLYFTGVAFKRFELTGTAYFCVYLLATFAVTVVISAASYHWFEKQFLNRKNRVTRRGSSKVAPRRHAETCERPLA